MDENRDLQILSPTHKNMGRETERRGDKHTYFLQTTPNSVSPVSSFSTVAKRHKVMPC